MANFRVFDYVIFAMSLCLSAAIGLYFAFFSKNVKSSTEYLYGNRQMKALPVGLSLYSSAMSALTIIGIPAEVYNYGIQYSTGIIGICLSTFITWFFILPIFCGNLSIKTPFEYFEKRFSYNVRLMSSFIHVVNTLLLMPLILYAPSLAMSQALQIPILVCTTVIGAICILYTTVGGFKTVVWTDSLQATMMLISCLVVLIVGVNKVGGISEVWSRAGQGGRLNAFDMDPNPLKRLSFWSLVIGLTFSHASHAGCNAGSLQRYMSLPSQKEAQLSSIIGLIGTCLIHVIGGFTGLTMYAMYTCDPVKNQEIASPNLLLPYFVTETIEYMPGFTGFFISGLLSAALSSLSSELNTIGGIIYYDFILKFFKNKITETKGTLIIKIIIFITGIICLCTVPLLMKSKHVFELTLSLGGITFGARLGMILLGILFPKANSMGALCGASLSMAFITWLSAGSHYYQVSSKFKLPVSEENCTNIFNTTLVYNITATTTTNIELSDIFMPYRISFMYYALIGTVITIIVGMAVSYMTGPNKAYTVDPLLIAPFLRSYVEKENTSKEMEQIDCHT